MEERETEGGDRECRGAGEERSAAPRRAIQPYASAKPTWEIVPASIPIAAAAAKGFP
jgi:hypothetical protein